MYRSMILKIFQIIMCALLPLKSPGLLAVSLIASVTFCKEVAVELLAKLKDSVIRTDSNTQWIVLLLPPYLLYSLPGDDKQK